MKLIPKIEMLNLNHGKSLRQGCVLKYKERFSKKHTIPMIMGSIKGTRLSSGRRFTLVFIKAP